MKRLGTFDRLLLGTLLPIWLAVLGLHVKEVLRTGLAEPPIYASPTPQSEYPKVGGFRLERGRGGAGLEVGDLLIRVGDEDLSGVGYLGFDAIALERAGTAGSAPLVLERDGERFEVRLEMLSHEFPWFRAIPITALVLVCVLILLRAPSAGSRLLFGVAMSIAMLQTIFIGGPRIQGYAGLLLFNGVGGIAFFWVLRWVVYFPPELDDAQRLSPAWAWLGLLWYVPRAMYVAGGPLPTQSIPQVALITDGFFLLLALAIATRNYRLSGPVGRRRIKWLLLAGYVGVLPLGLLTLVSALRPGELALFFEASVLGTLVFAAGLLLSVVRFNLFDVDRVLSATAAVSLAVLASVAALVALLLPLARTLAGWSGLDPLVVQSGLGLAMAGVALPLSVRIRPALDRVFFPERAALRAGTEAMLREVAGGEGPEDVVLRFAERIHEILRPEFTVAYERSGSRFEATGRWGRAAPDALDADSSISWVLAQEGVPLALERGSTEHVGADFDRADRVALDAMGCRMLVPVQDGDGVRAFVALGAKQSGDVYTQTELARLGTVAERASRTVQRLLDAERLREGRAELESLRAEKEDADASNVAKSRFLASASHDLRQPLHALGLFSEAMAQRASDPVMRSLVGRVQDTVTNLQEMMDGILDLSRLEAGQVEARKEDVELGPLLARIGEEFRFQAEANGLELRVRPTRAVVLSDRLLLSRILQNLVVNALRYTDRGGVLVGARARGELVSIEVWDTGRGIPEDQLAGVFEEFRQLERDAGKEGPGLGLGLSIVDRLARLLGHELDVRSRVGRGTRFSVRAQRGSAAVPSEVPGPIAVPSDRIAGAVVLIVDDESAILAGMRELVAPWGAEVMTAASGDEAVARASERKPDVIVSDYRLGTETIGPAVIRAVQDAVGDAVPALIVTGDTSQVSVAELRATGFPFLHKPVRPAKLRAALGQLLRR